MSIYISGASGFVGKNFISYIKGKIPFRSHIRESDFVIKEKIVLHLAGKAHDLKNTADSSEYYKINTCITMCSFY